MIKQLSNEVVLRLMFADEPMHISINLVVFWCNVRPGAVEKMRIHVQLLDNKLNNLLIYYNCKRDDHNSLETFFVRVICVEKCKVSTNFTVWVDYKTHF